MAKTKIKNKPTKAIKNIEDIAKRMRGEGSVVVGLPKGSNDYPDGTSVIMVGAVHEFGSPARNIPQRSFLRTTAQGERKKYKALFKKLSISIVKGKMDSTKALNIIGLQFQTDVRQKITDINEPPLMNREGNPLIDTGHLRQSIIYQVNN